MDQDLQTSTVEQMKKPFGEDATIYPKPEGEQDEKKIVNKINSMRRIWEPKNQKLRDEASDNEKVYFARYMDKDKFTSEDMPIQVPKLFLNLETNIPVVTRKTPEPIVDVYPITKKNQKIAKILSRDLKQAWQMSEDDDGLEMQPKQEENMRNLYIQKVLIYKYYFDPVLKKMCVKVVPLEKIILPFDSNDVYACPFIIELVTDSFGMLKEKFPEKAEKLQEELGDKASDETMIDYIEYWENDKVCWSYKDILLGCEKNPNWNWKYRDGITRKKKQDANHFKRPQKPYIIETDIKRNTGLIAATSLVEIAKSAVRATDRRKNEIDINVRMANPKLAIAGQRMEKESASALDLNKAQVVYLDKAETVEGSMQVITSRAVDNAAFTDMQDTNAIMDGITGATATLRGERGSDETATGRQILRDSSLGRLEPLFRLNERVAQKIFNARAQILAVFGFEDSPVYSDDEEGNADIQYINRDIFRKRKFVITVKDGSTVPTDKKSEQAQAWDEVQAGVISVLDYHKVMEKDDPEGLAKRAWQQMNAPQELYSDMGDDMNYNTEAVKHIMGIVYKQMDPMQVYETQDVDMFKAHLKTHADYFAGKEVWDDLITFKDIVDLQTIDELQMHVKMETDMLEQMVKDNMAQLEQMKAMGMPIDPAMLDQLLGKQEQAPEAPIAPQPVEGSEVPVDQSIPQPQMPM